MKMNKHFLFLLIAIFLLPAGCTMAPKYTQPEALIPDQIPSWKENEDIQSTDEVQIVSDIKWREFFTDRKLQQIIEMALENNLDLRLAALNVEKVQALYGVRRSELFPVINVVGGGGKQQTSADLTSPGDPRTTEQFNVNLGVTSWEIDFFGRIRSLEEQALQEYLATEEARRSAQITLISEVARTYLILAADRENLRLSQSTLETQQGSYDLIRLNYEVGIATELDLSRSQTQVDTAKRNIARYTQLVRRDQNALILLVGITVPEDLLPLDLSGIIPLREIFPDLSSEVLLVRPDILAAEYQLKAAYAFIGAARAAFFPRISLTTFLGTASDDLSGLFKSGTGTWSFAPQVSLPIFDARTWAAYNVSQATQEIALARYEKAIQTAFREVADTLAVRSTINQQISSQQSIVDSGRKIYSLSEERYTAGIDSYLGVLDSQRSLYAAQQILTDLRLVGLANQVKLYAVLGGGGEPEDTDSTADNRVPGK